VASSLLWQRKSFGRLADDVGEGESRQVAAWDTSQLALEQLQQLVRMLRREVLHCRVVAIETQRGAKVIQARRASVYVYVLKCSEKVCRNLAFPPAPVAPPS